MGLLEHALLSNFESTDIGIVQLTVEHLGAF